MSELLQRQPQLADMTDAQLERTRDDFCDILRYCAAAIVARDHTVLDEFTMWLRDHRGVRGVPSSTVRVSYECIASVLGGGYPRSVAMLTAAAGSI